jgi:hypothetical protein
MLIVPILAASGVKSIIGKFLYLSMIIAIVVIPTRLSKGDVRKGPRRAVFAYLIVAFGFYFSLRFVLPRIQ